MTNKELEPFVGKQVKVTIKPPTNGCDLIIGKLVKYNRGAKRYQYKIEPTSNSFFRPTAIKSIKLLEEPNSNE